MKKLLLLIICFTLSLGVSNAQIAASRNTMGQSLGSSSSGSSNKKSGLRGGAKSDSLSSHNKEFPKGRYVFTLDERFGDVRPAQIDTVTHMFMNTIFTDGLRGEYNYTGNLGSPRINRIFSMRSLAENQFLFMQPYDYFAKSPSEFQFTNTFSPIANLSYSSCGNRINGEDHFKVKYAANVNKQIGVGFDINYLYGRGYYSNQSTSLFGAGFNAYYQGERYQAYLLLTSNKQKIFENGGITNDMFITHPESFDDTYATSEIPTVLSDNWNRNSNQHVLFTHRYNVGYYKKEPMNEDEIKARKFALESEKEQAIKEALEARIKQNPDADEDELKKEVEKEYQERMEKEKAAKADKKRNLKNGEREVLSMEEASRADSLLAQQVDEEEFLKDVYVPVTSFFHTLRFDNYERIYQAHTSPTNLYADDFYQGKDVIGRDSIFDKTKHYRLRNYAGISMLERAIVRKDSTKWIIPDLKAYAVSDLRHFTLPDENGKPVATNEHNLSVGGQLSKSTGKALHYNITAETCLLGYEFGQVKVDGNADFNFKLFGDTVTLAASGFFHSQKPSYYLRHYHSRHFWWDDDLSMMTHTRLQGLLGFQRNQSNWSSRTTLKATIDGLTNYTYIGETYTPDTSVGMTGYNLHVRQCDAPISVLGLHVGEDLALGHLNWQSVVTIQKSTNQDALPVPLVNIYTNLFLKFRIAKVLQTELGADMRYFTKYAAPDYAPSVGQYVVQENSEKVETGNYPIINAYANFNLKGTRFFVMYSRAYSSAGNAFTVPHYPINPGSLRIGISWDFFN